MNCILIDDEANCLEGLSLHIRKYCPELTILGAYRDPRRGIEAIYTLKPSVVFLDVEMPELNGFDVLEQCSNIPFHVIFTTAHHQYAIKAIKYSALDYLLKPIHYKELVASVHKASQIDYYVSHSLQRETLIHNIHAGHSSKARMALPTSEGLVFLAIKDIVYCESEGNYTKVYFVGGRIDLFTKKLKEIEEILSDSYFYRVHHSYLINLHEVTRYVKSEGGDLMMSSGTLIPISRHSKQDVLEALAKL